jgi:hypothetical protein
VIAITSVRGPTHDLNSVSYGATTPSLSSSTVLLDFLQSRNESGNLTYIVVQIIGRVIAYG